MNATPFIRLGTATAILTVLPIAPGAYSHGVYFQKVKPLLRRADVIAIARVKTFTKDESRCETTYTCDLEIQKYLRGKWKTPRIKFSYSHYYGRKANWPWQEDCPSVHYFVPPLAESLSTKDGRLIVTLQVTPDGQSYRATATMDIKHLPLVRSILAEKSKNKNRKVKIEKGD